MENNKDQEKGRGSGHEPLGNRSTIGSTSTNPDKQRMQTTFGNQPDQNDDEKGAGGKAHENTSNAENRMGNNEDKDEDLFDQGSVRSAAFTEDKPNKKGPETTNH